LTHNGGYDIHSHITNKKEVKVMVKRINVSVPDDLFEKIQIYKDEINLSGIFQKAISEKIESKEKYQKLRAKKERQKDEKIMARLKKQRDELETFSYESGKEHGYELATTLSYRDLQYITKLKINKHTNVRELDCGFDDYFDENIFKARKGDKIFNSNLVYDIDDINDSTLSKPFLQWLKGWQEGIIDFWKEVEKKL
jgi:post-segregation antitoxin (ccd killing protein)